MRGEIIGVWSDTLREIWLPLIDQEDVPEASSASCTVHWRRH